MGEDFYPLAPVASLIHLEDIAHALSLTCRANGHFIRFYSVAQHSINCANEAKAQGLELKIQLACLLHDASEAYLSDIPRPVKHQLPEYIAAEQQLQSMIYNKFLGSDLSEEETETVRQIDQNMLVGEFAALMKKKVFDESPNFISKPNFDFCEPVKVEFEFIELFQKLYR